MNSRSVSSAPVSTKPAFSRLTKADLFKLAGLAAFFVLMAIACVAIAPMIAELTEPGGLERVVEDVQNAGVGGVFMLLGFQFLQIVVAFIPGEVVQLAAGMMYGPWGGALIVLVGCIVSSAFIFVVVHKLGAPFVHAMIPEKWMAKLEKFEQSEKLDVMVFVLFLIPGLPKDVFTYLMPLTHMRMRDFLFLANVGRIPGILISTFGAAGLIEGDYTQSIILFAYRGRDRHRGSGDAREDLARPCGHEACDEEGGFRRIGGEAVVSPGSQRPQRAVSYAFEGTSGFTACLSRGFRLPRFATPFVPRAMRDNAIRPKKRRRRACVSFRGM